MIMKRREKLACNLTSSNSYNRYQSIAHEYFVTDDYKKRIAIIWLVEQDVFIIVRKKKIYITRENESSMTSI